MLNNEKLRLLLLIALGIAVLLILPNLSGLFD